MKKFLIVAVIVLFILGNLISCAPEPYVLFDNFMNDLDIEGRFSDYSAEIARGKSTDIILKGIDVLIEDLNTMTIDNATAKEITGMFITSSQALKEAAELNIQNKNEQSKGKLDYANELFNQAVKKEYSFSKKSL